MKSSLLNNSTIAQISGPGKKDDVWKFSIGGLSFAHFLSHFLIQYKVTGEKHTIPLYRPLDLSAFEHYWTHLGGCGHTSWLTQAQFVDQSLTSLSASQTILTGDGRKHARVKADTSLLICRLCLILMSGEPLSRRPPLFYIIRLCLFIWRDSWPKAALPLWRQRAFRKGIRLVWVWIINECVGKKEIN